MKVMLICLIVLHNLSLVGSCTLILDFSYMPIGYSWTWANVVSQVGATGGLTIINLQGNNLTFTDINNFLSALVTKNPTTPIEINLSSNSGTGIITFASALGKSLTKLNVSRNALSDFYYNTTYGSIFSVLSYINFDGNKNLSAPKLVRQARNLKTIHAGISNAQCFRTDSSEVIKSCISLLKIT